MALEQVVWDILKEHRPETMLCLGYPDLLITEELDVPEAEDADAIRKWHGWRHKIYDTTKAFATLGITPTYIDIRPSRGVEAVVDLNKALPHRYEGFGAVLDPGTLEHCFNIGQAFKNIIYALAQGGLAIHTNPLSMVNHGFWNLCPTAYYDFYAANGFTLLDLSILAGPVDARQKVDSKPVSRFAAGPELVNLCVARRDEVKPPVFPTQTKYQRNPNLK